MWNQSGWYAFRVFGHYYDPYYEMNQGDPSINYGNSYVFYLNVSVEQQQSASSMDEPTDARPFIEIFVEVVVLPLRLIEFVIQALVLAL
jgi:hypothetical protein